MGTLFHRIRNSISADLHELLDQKEESNPVATLKQHVRQCEEQVEQVRKLLERQYLLKDQFNREYLEASEFADKRKYQAEVALKTDEQELYQFALQEHREYQERSLRLKESLNHCIQQLQDLEQKYETMKHKLKEMHLKQMEFMGQENVARANYRINQLGDTRTLSGKIYSAFQDMESYLDRLEHKVNSNYYRNTIDTRIAELERKIRAEKPDPSV